MIPQFSQLRERLWPTVSLLTGLKNFVPRISELRQKFDCDDPSTLSIDGHPVHVTPRVITLYGAGNVFLIGCLAYSSYLVQPLDLCLFGLFKIFDRKERQSKEMKRKTRKIYQT
jgi:hypothetical protein